MINLLPRACKWVLILTIVLLTSSPLYFLSFVVDAAAPIGSKTVTLYPIADSYVNQTSPDTNYGEINRLRLSYGTRYGYIMFDLSSLPPNAVVFSAALRLYLTGIGGYVGNINTYYCSDNSWTELGITWNNKPDFASEATDERHFGMWVWLNQYYSWDVTADVRVALSQGKLTEVILRKSSGTASFHSREGDNSPELVVEYSPLPVFVVHLESIQDTGATNNLGFATFADYTFCLPADIDVVAGSYQVSYSHGYMFMKWETSGGVTVSDAMRATTTVTVSGDGTLRAVGNVRRLEYTYDHGLPVRESRTSGCIDAVRFTPLFSGQLLMARFYIYDTSSYESNAFKVHVMDENRSLFTAFERTPTSEGWFDVDLSSYGISVNEGTDFYVGMEWIVDDNPDLGKDETSPSGRSWHWNGTHWKEEIDSDFMISAVVGTLIDHVIVVAGTVFHISTESNSTVSNFQFIKDDKKLLFDVTRPTDTHGFCNITIPNQLLGGPFNVMIDEQPLSEVLSLDNGTHTWLYFTYPHIVHRIDIIGTIVMSDFPSLNVFLTLNPTTIGFEGQVSVDVHVTDGTSAIENADVQLASDNGGSFTPSYGYTNSNGDFSATFTASSVSEETNVTITATATKSGYVDGSDYDYVMVLPPGAPSLSVTVKANPNTVKPGETSTITVQVTDGTNPVERATLTVSCDRGSLSSESGNTNSNGYFSCTFTAPSLMTLGTVCTITVTATKEGYLQVQDQTQITITSIELWVLIVIVAIVAVVAAVLIARSRKKPKPEGQTTYDFGGARACPSCGAELKPNARFCHKCGKMFGKEESTKREPSVQLRKDKTTFGIIAELQALKSKILLIPQIYPTRAFVTGANTAKKEIPAVCQVIDDAIRALQTGLDIYNRPITKPQIAAGLKRLVDQTRRPLWVGSTSLVISVQGMFELKKYMNKLEEIASKIEPRIPPRIEPGIPPKVEPGIPPKDESILTSESMSRVESKDDLRPGDVIRVWNEWTTAWIPGWWCEVLRVEEDRVYLRDLKSGEEKSRHIADTVGSAWGHPNPERAKGLGLRAGRSERERLQKLKSQYAMLDFSASSEDEIAETLRRELQWRNSHESQYHNMKEEFEIHELAIRKVGEELNKRGGRQLMLQMFERVQGTRTLEMIWDGIGDWRG